MTELKQDVVRIQETISSAFQQTGGLSALADVGQPDPQKLQKTLEQTMEQFEQATLKLRRLCEKCSTGVGGYGNRQGGGIINTNYRRPVFGFYLPDK